MGLQFPLQHIAAFELHRESGVNSAEFHLLKGNCGSLSAPGRHSWGYGLGGDRGRVSAGPVQSDSLELG